MEEVGNVTELVLADMMGEVERWTMEKGWADDGRSVGDEMALLHSEISEALEEFRAGRMHETFVYENGTSSHLPRDCDGMMGKPIGFPIELADLFIRLLDTCQRHKIDLAKVFRVKMDYNWQRAHRHGGKAL